MKSNNILLSIIFVLVLLLVGGGIFVFSSRMDLLKAPVAQVEIPKTEPTIETTTGADLTDVEMTDQLGAGLADIELTTPVPTAASWVGSAACNVSATSVCVASGVITCSPDCETECGTAAQTISTCTNSCGIATTKSCPATAACEDDLTIVKKAFRNEASNTSSNYNLTTEINQIARNQIFVYAIYLKNIGSVVASDRIYIKDGLNGDGQNNLTFLDENNAGCTYSESNSRTFICENISLNPGQEKVFTFRVKVNNTANNGQLVKNTAKVWYNGTFSKESIKELTVSTIVGCNNTCTTDSECSTGLICDSGSGKCRKAACSETESCVCPTPTPAPKAGCNEDCSTNSDCSTGLVCDASTTTCRKSACKSSDTCVCPTAARPTTVRTPTPTDEVTVPDELTTPTERPTVVVQPTILPETGILDFPGVAAFGGGLLLAIVGILLAL